MVQKMAGIAESPASLSTGCYHPHNFSKISNAYIIQRVVSLTSKPQGRNIAAQPCAQVGLDCSQNCNSYDTSDLSLKIQSPRGLHQILTGCPVLQTPNFHVFFPAQGPCHCGSGNFFFSILETQKVLLMPHLQPVGLHITSQGGSLAWSLRTPYCPQEEGTTAMTQDSPPSQTLGQNFLMFLAEWRSRRRIWRRRSRRTLSEKLNTSRSFHHTALHTSTAYANTLFFLSRRQISFSKLYIFQNLEYKFMVSKKTQRSSLLSFLASKCHISAGHGSKIIEIFMQNNISGDGWYRFLRWSNSVFGEGVFIFFFS